MLILDTETYGLDHQKHKAFSCGFYANGEPLYIDFREEGTDKAIELIMGHDLLIGHNLKFDLHMLIQAGVPWKLLKSKQLYCTQIAEAMINEHRQSYSLDALGQDYFEIPKIDIVSQIREHFGTKQLAKKKAMGRISEMPYEFVKKYCLRDCQITELLYITNCDRMKEFPIFSLEMEVMKHLIEIERRGIPVDQRKLDSAKDFYESEIKSIEDEIEVNVSSPIEMEAKFKELGIFVEINPDTGRPRFGKDVLKQIDHPFPQKVLRLRQLRKIKEGFLSGMLDQMVGNSLYTNFHQARSDEYGTISGRLSSSEPNMQQVPKRNGEAFEIIRSLYVAPEGMTWLCGDWSQFEFRMFAHYSQDKKLYDAYRNNPDIDYHQLVADMAGIDRRTAKTINLGLSFGMGENRLAKELGRSLEDSKELFEKYHSKFPKVKEFLKIASSLGAKRGFVKTILGRYIRFPESKLAYKAGALIFQGGAADIMKKKIIELNSNIDGLRLIVHDEFNFIVSNDNVERDLKLFKQIMQDVPELNVPVRADVSYGRNWWEASK